MDQCIRTRTLLQASLSQARLLSGTANPYGWGMHIGLSEPGVMFLHCHMRKCRSTDYCAGLLQQAADESQGIECANS